MEKKITILLILIVGALCTESESTWKDPNNKWGYHLGGSDWSENKVLRVNQCGSPLAQSPVDIPAASRTDQYQVQIIWNDVDQTVPIRFKEGAFYSPGKFSTIKLKNQNGLDVFYQSTYMEYHAPGENRLQGNFYDLELLIYHTIDPEHISRTMIKEAVISVLFRKSYQTSKNPFFLQWNPGSLNVQSDYKQIEGTATLNIKSLSKQLEGNTDVYNYFGSYTRPPCTENVNWFVFDQVLDANYEQLVELNKFFRINADFAGGRGNAREIQDLAGRTVAKVNAKFGLTSSDQKTNLLQKQSKLQKIIKYMEDKQQDF